MSSPPLFFLGSQAREEKMDHAARHLLCQEKAPPLLDEIREHILATSKTVLPRSTAGQACNYTLALWKNLACFLARVPIPIADFFKNVHLCISSPTFKYAGSVNA